MNPTEISKKIGETISDTAEGMMNTPGTRRIIQSKVDKLIQDILKDQPSLRITTKITMWHDISEIEQHERVGKWQLQMAKHMKGDGDHPGEYPPAKMDVEISIRG